MTDLRSTTGWGADPGGRHQWRYFVEGEPTDLVRDGDQQSIDPLNTNGFPQVRPIAPSVDAADEEHDFIDATEAAAKRASTRYLVAIGLALVVLFLAGSAGLFLWARGGDRNVGNTVSEIVHPPSPTARASDLAAKIRSRCVRRRCRRDAP